MKEKRCTWAGDDDYLQAYHDVEWGVPVHDDHILFEFLILETMQAGLSWHMILKKRENFRRAFRNFDPRIVAAFDKKDIDQLMEDEGIIRNRKKIEAAVQNAKEILKIQKEHDSFDAYIWKFVKGKPKNNSRASEKDIPAKTSTSDAMSKEMKKKGFLFLGSTICYAFMQAVGMVNDHVITCYRYAEV